MRINSIVEKTPINFRRINKFVWLLLNSISTIAGYLKSNSVYKDTHKDVCVCVRERERESKYGSECDSMKKVEKQAE